jgi:hypothetical protein
MFVLVILYSVLAFGQTAREYYKEVHDANGLNPLLMFACFPEQDTGKFDTMALTRTFPRTAAEKHLSKVTEKDKQMFAKSDLLYLQTFYKGVAREPLLLEKQDSHSDVGWVLKSTGEVRGHPEKMLLTYRINWQTLRYEMNIEVGTASKAQYGKCELIP